MDHTITLNDSNEELLLWASRRGRRGGEELMLQEWINRGLQEAAEDLNKTIAGLGEIDAETRARVIRAILGRPEPVREPPPPEEPPRNP